MFDNLEKNNQSLGASGDKKSESPKSVEDIFSDTEQASAKPDVFKPKIADFSPNAEEIDDDSFSALNKILVLTGGILFLSLLGYGGYWGYNNFFVNKSEQPSIQDNIISEDKNNSQENNDSGVNSDVKTEGNIPETTSADQTTDSDQDGLSDEEEKTLGMDINNIDSDGDGLFDREEVRVYKTNPLLGDTDGDGHSDGNEVKGGYDPNGPGKLYELK